jgi:hypothetical protein
MTLVCAKNTEEWTYRSYTQCPQYNGIKDRTFYKYSEHSNTGPFGIWMVIFWTLIRSGFWMVRYSDARFYKICPVFNGASLDRLIIKNILFMTISLIKRSRLVDHSVFYNDHLNTGPLKNWTNLSGIGIRMPFDNQTIRQPDTNGPFENWTCPLLRCSLYVYACLISICGCVYHVHFSVLYMYVAVRSEPGETHYEHLLLIAS